MPTVEPDKALDKSSLCLGWENSTMRQDCSLHQSEPLLYRLPLIINNSKEIVSSAKIFNLALVLYFLDEFIDKIVILNHLLIVISSVIGSLLSSSLLWSGWCCISWREVCCTWLSIILLLVHTHLRRMQGWISSFSLAFMVISNIVEENIMPNFKALPFLGSYMAVRKAI